MDVTVTSRTFVCVWTCAVLCLCAVGSAAAPLGSSRSRRVPFTDNTLKYLMAFGYLPASDMETGNLRTDDQLREAIRTLQTFGHIPATGEVDERTRRLMARPRCGVTDLPDPAPTRGRRRRFAIHPGTRWDHTDLTWSLRTRHLEYDIGQVRRELHDALAIWSKDSRLNFQEINSDDADIIIKFHSWEHGDGYAFDGPGRILAHAFFPGEERGGDVHFDQDETWLLEYQHKSDVEGTRLFMVAAHEFGHSLGLSHSSEPNSLMFPWYQTLNHNFSLPDDDRRGIQQLYGAKDRWAKIPEYNPGDGRPPWRPSYPPASPTTSTTTARPPHTTPPHTHRPHHRPSPHPRPTDSPDEPHHKPDTCDTAYDAVSIIRREMFIFKGQYMWRINDKGIMDGYPAPILHLWKELPRNMTHVDAVYERLDKKIVFFIGREVYLFDGNKLESGYPKSLRSLGLPPQIDHVDAALVWGHNSKTYFYSGNLYWRFDEDEQHTELDYPREITPTWKGMGSHFDAVFQWKDGKTYFFKGKGFWKLNDMQMRAENEIQIPSAAFWMNCPNYDLGKTAKTPKKWPKEVKSPLIAANDSSFTTGSYILYTFILLYYLISR